MNELRKTKLRWLTSVKEKKNIYIFKWISVRGWLYRIDINKIRNRSKNSLNYEHDSFVVYWSSARHPI